MIVCVVIFLISFGSIVYNSDKPYNVIKWYKDALKQGFYTTILEIILFMSTDVFLLAICDAPQPFLNAIENCIPVYISLPITFIIPIAVKAFALYKKMKYHFDTTIRFNHFKILCEINPGVWSYDITSIKYWLGSREIDLSLNNFYEYIKYFYWLYHKEINKKNKKETKLKKELINSWEEQIEKYKKDIREKEKGITYE